jgi:hypothetical protein
VPTKATKLIDVYTFTGAETWVSSGQSYYADVGISSSAKKPSNGQEYATILHDFLETVTANELYYGAKTDGIAMYNNGRIYISSSRYANISSLANTKLYYVLNTATETNISLDLTYPVWDGGTEQILPVNDSTPDTAPILCDIDCRGMIPVNATVDPSGSGTVDGTGNYRYHSIATLEATPSDEIYRFLRWEDENGDTVSTNSVFSFEVGE